MAGWIAIGVVGYVAAGTFLAMRFLSLGWLDWFIDRRSAREATVLTTLFWPILFIVMLCRRPWRRP